MKKIVVLLVLLCAAPIWAVDLRNEDSRRYEVKIHSGGTTHTSIESGTTQMSVCSDCEIEVVGVGSIKASGSETVVIKDGSLEKR